MTQTHPFTTVQQLLAARPKPRFGVSLSLPADAYTFSDKGVRIVVAGRLAVERLFGSWGAPQLDGSRWTEVVGMHECEHGCKLYGRRRGCVDEFVLMHSVSYGCQLGRRPETRNVPVSIRAKAS